MKFVTKVDGVAIISVEVFCYIFGKLAPHIREFVWLNLYQSILYSFIINIILKCFTLKNIFGRTTKYRGIGIGRKGKVRKYYGIDKLIRALC